MKNQDKPSLRKNLIRNSVAAAVFLVAAGVFLSFLPNHKAQFKYSLKKNTATLERKAKRLNRFEADRAALFEIIKKARKQEDGNALKTLVQEFPYGSMDCRMVSKQEEITAFMPQQTSDSNPYPLFVPFMNQLGDDAVSKFGMNIVPSALKTDLTMAIKKLKTKKDAQGLSSMLKYLDSLNLEWEGDGDKLPWHQNLYHTYFEMYEKALLKNEKMTPELLCIARNYYANSIIHLTRSAAADLILEDPNTVGVILDSLPKFQRAEILEKGIENLLHAPSSNPDQIQKLYSQMPNKLREEFLELIRLYPTITTRTIPGEAYTRFRSTLINSSSQDISTAISYWPQ